MSSVNIYKESKSGREINAEYVERRMAKDGEYNEDFFDNDYWSYLKEERRSLDNVFDDYL